jgi:hypothetical protein
MNKLPLVLARDWISLSTHSRYGWTNELLPHFLSRCVWWWCSIVGSSPVDRRGDCNHCLNATKHRTFHRHRLAGPIMVLHLRSANVDARYQTCPSCSSSWPPPNTPVRNHWRNHHPLPPASDISLAPPQRPNLHETLPPAVHHRPCHPFKPDLSPTPVNSLDPAPTPIKSWTSSVGDVVARRGVPFSCSYQSRPRHGRPRQRSLGRLGSSSVRNTCQIPGGYAVANHSWKWLM